MTRCTLFNTLFLKVRKSVNQRIEESIRVKSIPVFKKTLKIPILKNNYNLHKPFTVIMV